jgi:undecaprenyl-diphosphatase
MLTNYFILGAIQGIFEWIPVSSQGIVAVAGQLLATNQINPLEVALFSHLGTFLAAMIYFREEWYRLVTFKDLALLKFLVIAVGVSGIIGFFLYSAIKNMAVGNGLLLITGIGLLFTAYCHKTKKPFNISPGKLALISGLLQGLAVIPGLSRSGATIFGLGLGNFKPAEILKISYMMSVPAVLAMAVFLFVGNPDLLWQGWPVLVSSFITGFLTLNLLLRISARINFFKFALFFAFLCFLGVGLGFLL